MALYIIDGMKKSKHTFFYVYGIIIFLTMCSTMNLSFTWAVPMSVAMTIGLFFSIIFMLSSNDLQKNVSNFKLCTVLGILCFFLICISPNTGVGILKYFSLWFCSTSIIFLSMERKCDLLSIFTKGTALIIVISLPAWILYLTGVPLPHDDTILFENGFHVLTDYHFFLLNGFPGDKVFPRFASMFLEPGQLATPCAFLIFANNCNFRKKEVIILLVAVLFSFSLIGYGLLICGFLLHSLLLSKKYRILKSAFFIFFISTVTVLSIQTEEDNPLYALIISRLELDEEKGIVGNNRTTDSFDIKFDKLMASSDKYWGIASEIDADNNWTSNTSGLKKFIVMYGLIGLFLLFFFLLLLFRSNMCTYSWVFFVVLIVGFIPRSMLTSPYWLYIILVGFPVLKWRSSNMLRLQQAY